MIGSVEVGRDELGERVDPGQERRISLCPSLCRRPEVLEEPDWILARRQPPKLADLSKERRAVGCPAPAIVVCDVGERPEALGQAVTEYLCSGRKIGRAG
jgi:hypothetical protein